MFVKHWMQPHPITVEVDASLAQVREALQTHRIRHLPVLDQGRLVGIVSRGDVIAATPLLDEQTHIERYRMLLRETTCPDFMTREPHTVEPGDTIDKAAEMMVHHRIAGLPVLRESRLTGIITETDIFRALIEILGMAGQSVRMECDLENQGDALIALIESLRARKMTLLNLATFTDRRQGGTRALVRVRGGDPQ